MTETFKLPSNATKKVILDKYNELLDAFRAKAKALELAHKQQGEAARHADRVALADAGDVTVLGAVERVDAFRSEISSALSELRLNLGTEAERLVTLRRAVTLQEARLEELHEIEAAADAMQQLSALYDERRSELEAASAARLKAMTVEFDEKKATLSAALTKAREEASAENTQRKAAQKADDADRKQAREREEAEYIYARDRARRLDQDAFDEKRVLQEKALADKVAKVSAELLTREAELNEREAATGKLEQQVAGFDKAVEREVKAATSQLKKQLEDDFAHRSEVAALERGWEVKLLQQTIAHLEASLETAAAKEVALREELTAAQTRVNAIATAAIDGAASQSAFRSVNKIALEQARRPEGTSDKG